MGVKKDTFSVLFLYSRPIRSVRCVRSTPTQQGGAEGELRKT